MRLNSTVTRGSLFSFSIAMIYRVVIPACSARASFRNKWYARDISRCIEGVSEYRIADRLEKEQILTPTKYWKRKGVRRTASAGRGDFGSMLARCAELDSLFTKTYEDNTSGKLSDERFVMITKRYDDEQLSLKKKISALQAEIGAEEKSKHSAAGFFRR